MGPGPGGVVVEDSTGAGDSGGDVEEPVADGFGPGLFHRTGQSDGPGPGEHINSGGSGGDPGLVRYRVGEGQVGRPAGFEICDDSFRGASLRVTALQSCGPTAAVGDEHLVSPPVDGVE